MDHASEYSHKLVSAEEEAVRGAVWHHASFPPYFDEFPGQEEEDEMHLMVFPGLVPAATCGLNPRAPLLRQQRRRPQAARPRSSESTSKT